MPPWEIWMSQLKVLEYRPRECRSCITDLIFLPFIPPLQQHNYMQNTVADEVKSQALIEQTFASLVGWNSHWLETEGSVLILVMSLGKHLLFI